MCRGNLNKSFVIYTRDSICITSDVNGHDEVSISLRIKCQSQSTTRFSPKFRSTWSSECVCHKTCACLRGKQLKGITNDEVVSSNINAHTCPPYFFSRSLTLVGKGRANEPKPQHYHDYIFYQSNGFPGI